MIRKSATVVSFISLSLFLFAQTALAESSYTSIKNEVNVSSNSNTQSSSKTCYKVTTDGNTVEECTSEDVDYVSPNGKTRIKVNSNSNNTSVTNVPNNQSVSDVERKIDEVEQEVKSATDDAIKEADEKKKELEEANKTLEEKVKKELSLIDQIMQQLQKLRESLFSLF